MWAALGQDMKRFSTKGPFTQAKISTDLSSRWLLFQNKI
jgi:hypothetical protein